MVITQTDVKKIFSIHVPTGKWLKNEDLQAIVSSFYALQPEDWEPHTLTRPTTYPKWKHVIAGTLSNLKKQNLIKHDKSNQSYMF